MNTNDLPPAAKLAALIEAGRVANPDLGHGRGAYLKDGAACALGFAALAAGASRAGLDYDLSGGGWDEFLCYIPLGTYGKFVGMGLGLVADMNDRGATLDEIIHSLREGELALS